MCAFRDEGRLAEAMLMSLKQAREVIADAAITTKTKEGYLSTLSRLDAVARRAGVQGGMKDKETFIRFLASLLVTGRGGTSSATQYRSALAWRQLREGTPRWALDQDIRDATDAVAYASRLQDRPRGALTLNMLREMCAHVSDKECQTMAVVQWCCGLRSGQLPAVPVDCLEGDLLLVEADKRRRRKSQVQTEIHWKPIDDRAVAIVRQAMAYARAQGRDGRDRLFTTSIQKYREVFKRAIEAAGFTEIGLDFVPHALRHGFVSETTTALIPAAIRARLGMALGTVPRYAETNASRLKRARKEN